MSSPEIWLTAEEAVEHVTHARQLISAGYAGFTDRGLRNWTQRGHLTAGGINDDGLMVFRLADVARAELATRARALRLVGIGAH